MSSPQKHLCKNALHFRPKAAAKTIAVAVSDTSRGHTHIDCVRPLRSTVAVLIFVPVIRLRIGPGGVLLVEDVNRIVAFVARYEREFVCD